MNTKHLFAKRISTLALLVSLSAAFGLQRGVAQEKIGVYDSRAVAIAFAGSPQFEKEMSQLAAKYEAAKKAGQREVMDKLKAEGKARQVSLHQQGFGTVPVNDILAHITNALPEIQKNAGVSLIVSKWDEAELKKHPDAERVDVTMKLVDALEPKEQQRQRAIEIQKQKPLTPEQMKQIKD